MASTVCNIIKFNVLVYGPLRPVITWVQYLQDDRPAISFLCPTLPTPFFTFRYSFSASDTLRRFSSDLEDLIKQMKNIKI